VVVLAGRRPFALQNRILLSAALILVAWLFFTIYPQLNFKPQERVLTIDPSGIRTTIGKLRGSRSWREIKAIENRGGLVYLIVAKTLNAFVVPQRAFKGPEQQSQFLELARRWHAAAHAS
jgi:hypothetical protein